MCVCVFSVCGMSVVCVCVSARALGMWHVSGMCVACVWYVCARVLCVADGESWEVNKGGSMGEGSWMRKAECSGRQECGKTRR